MKKACDLWWSLIHVCLHVHSINHDGVCVLFRHRWSGHADWSESHISSISKCDFRSNVTFAPINLQSHGQQKRYWLLKIKVDSEELYSVFRLMFLLVNILAFSSESFWIAFDLHGGCPCFQLFSTGEKNSAFLKELERSFHHWGMLLYFGTMRSTDLWRECRILFPCFY